MTPDTLIQVLAVALLIIALFVIGMLWLWCFKPLPAQPKEVCEQYLYHLERRELL
jgi:hypothetical protein